MRSDHKMMDWLGTRFGMLGQSKSWQAARSLTSEINMLLSADADPN